MRLAKTRFWILLAIIVIAVVIVVGFSTFASANANSVQKDVSPDYASVSPARTVNEDLGAWKYTAGIGDDGVLHVLINFPSKTAADIEAFNTTNRSLVKEIQGNARVLVIFRQPLSVDEFKQLVQASGIKVENYEMRAVEADGTRITLNGGPSASNNELVPQSALDTMINSWQKLPGGATFKGFISVEGIATQVQISALLADKRVFTTELTRAVATQRLLKKLGVANTFLQDKSKFESRLSAPIYWNMENTGLAPK